MKKFLLLFYFIVAHHTAKAAPATSAPAEKLAEASIDGNLVRVKSLRTGRTATYRLDRLNHRGQPHTNLIERIERNGFLFVR